MIKKVSYTSTNTYDTLHSLTSATTTVWIVFHGIGYLSAQFLQLFRHLDSETNYIIAPQAPSKYYKDTAYRKVGASWLTKENTQIDMQSILHYLDAMLLQEALPKHLKINILGYSQGVSIATRWLRHRHVPCDNLIMISGVFPKELEAKDFEFLPETTGVIHIVGDTDPYFERKNVVLEQQRVAQILPQTEFRSHPGGHELRVETFEDL